jgi:hypothetical protein
VLSLLKWTKEEISKITNIYPNEGLDAVIQSLPNRTKTQIKSKINHMNLRVSQERKSISQSQRATRFRPELCNVDASKFIHLNCKEACYILGLVWADGYLVNRGKNKYKISIEMKEEDLSLLLPVFEMFGKWNISKRVRPNRKPQLTLSISNKELYLFLELHGYCNKKISSTKILENMTEDLQRYWIRGFFDGDGCCYINKNLFLYQISFAGQYEQDWSFLQPLNNVIPFTVTRRVQHEKSRSSFVRFQGKEKVSLFANFIYPDLIFDFGLQRKFNKLSQSLP